MIYFKEHPAQAQILAEHTRNCRLHSWYNTGGQILTGQMQYRPEFETYEMYSINESTTNF